MNEYEIDKKLSSLESRILSGNLHKRLMEMESRMTAVELKTEWSFGTLQGLLIIFLFFIIFLVGFFSYVQHVIS